MKPYFVIASLMMLDALSPLSAAPSRLEAALLDAVRQAHFEQVIDFGAGNEDHPVRAHLGISASRIAHPPNMDVAVIQFDAAGRLVDRADVLLSRDYPDGLIVPLDPDRGAAACGFCAGILSVRTAAPFRVMTAINSRPKAGRTIRR